MFRNTPIQRKLIVIVLLTTTAALLLQRGVLLVSEYLALRNATLRQFVTIGEVIGANSTAALAFQNRDDAEETLSALKGEHKVTAAALYDSTGKLFAHYPASLPVESLPARPEKNGHAFGHTVLTGFQPVVRGDKQLGTLYLRFDTTKILREWLWASLWFTVGVFAVVLIVAYLISGILRKQISQPILALAETARAVSERRDYSVRAPELGRDELGLLTDAFNQMLAQIHAQNLALRENEARVRAVLDSALSAVLVIDADGHITDWNARAEAMFGWKRAEALGRELADLIIPPHYRDGHRRGLKRFLQTGEGPVLGKLLELSALRRDGTEIPVELSISPMKTGDAVSFCGFITDLTGRKRTEELRAQLAAIVESSVNAIISKTLDGVVTSWNRGAEKLFGYTAAEAVGQPMHALIPPERASEESDIRARIARGEAIDQFETVRVKKDGTRIDVAMAISPIKDSQGRETGLSIIAHDISEEKRAEEQLRSSFKEIADLKAALDEHAIVAITDSQGKITYVNDKFCAISKYSREELLGQDHRIINSQHHPKEFFRELWTTIARGKVWKGEIKNRAKDGSYYWVDTTIVPFLNDEGKPRQYVAIRADITERKRAEEQLRASLKEIQDLKAALDEHAIVAITDPQGKITYVNDKFCAISKYSREELLGQDHRIINSQHHPKEFFRELWTTIARGKVWKGEIKNRAKDGSYYWVDTTIVPFLNDEGKPRQYVAIRADITERKLAERAVRESEERYRTLFETLIEGFCTLEVVLGPDGQPADFRFLEVNPAFEKQTGLKNAQGKLIRELLPSREDFWFEIYSQVAATGQAVHLENEARMLGRYFDVCAYRISGPESGKIAVLLNDITERKRSEQEILRLNADLERRVAQRTAELESANQELEAFSYSVSHDLRAPLRAVNGFAGIVLEDYGAQLPEEGQHYLERIRKGGQRMGDLIDDLLAFSRLSRQPMTRRTVDNRRLVQEIIEELAPQPTSNQLELRIGELPPAFGDPALLKQVWANLISNAIKYSRGRTPPVVEIGSSQANGENVYFVRDNGTGFDMRYAEKLFGVFQRLHREEEFEGTGVGLAIARRVIHRHGGRIWAESEIGRGATFYFSLGKEPTHPI